MDDHVTSGYARAVRRLAQSLGGLASSFLHLCLPRSCAGCRKVWLSPGQGHWCGDCFKALPWIQSPRCVKCGRPFLKSAPTADHYCGDCLLSSLPFDTARSATLYTGVVRERIHQLKFGGQLHWVPPLVELLSEAILKEGPLHAETVIPVPLHVKRLRQRGFNQSGLMAKMLGRSIRLPVHFGALIRKNWTEPQTRLNREDRLTNVKGAFTVKDRSVVEGRSVLLIDDVLTTGTTVTECARVLKKAGAAQVHILTVARALPHWQLV